jgi:PhoPQ-activated pathogenicity-related protein
MMFFPTFSLFLALFVPSCKIPNEHTTFTSDPILKSRTEDSIIAFTWDHFLKDPSQPEWLVRFPMVKASIRAMDAMQEYIRGSHAELGASIDYFSVTGASKRGWTTWLCGAVDPNRVKIIIPIVLDAINFVEVIHHQYRSYGGWTYALEDYVDMNITSRFGKISFVFLRLFAVFNVLSCLISRFYCFLFCLLVSPFILVFFVSSVRFSVYR